MNNAITTDTNILSDYIKIGEFNPDITITSKQNVYSPQPWYKFDSKSLTVSCIPVYLSNYLHTGLVHIKKVEMLKENKVMRFTFSDNKVIKIICHDNDTFDFNYAFYLAYSKYLYGKEMLPHGIEQKAKELMDIKIVNKLVKEAQKKYFNELKEKEKIKEAKKESQAIRERRVAKKIRKKNKKKQEEIKNMMTAMTKVMENK